MVQKNRVITTSREGRSQGLMLSRIARHNCSVQPTIGTILRLFDRDPLRSSSPVLT